MGRVHGPGCQGGGMGPPFHKSSPGGDLAPCRGAGSRAGLPPPPAAYVLPVCFSRYFCHSCLLLLLLVLLMCSPRRALVERSQQYPPLQGVPELREAVAEHSQRYYGLDLQPDTQVLITAGGE